MRFARNQVFASPSAAAAVVVVGRTANGRHDWKIQGSGVSFGHWQAQGIDQSVREGSGLDKNGPTSSDSGLRTAGLSPPTVRMLDQAPWQVGQVLGHA